MLRHAFLLLIVLCGCARNPVTGKNEITFISEDSEINIGQANYFLLQQSQGGDYNAHEEIDEYIKRIGYKLAAFSDRPNLPYEFVVLNNSIPNAWSLPGGKIAIYRGLLLELENEAELAAVLSHEIVHSAARHSAQQVERSALMSTGMAGLAVLLSGHKYENVAIGAAVLGSTMAVYKYSRTAELEADHYGIKYMVAAGYDPQAAVTLQEKFLRLSKDNQPDWLSGLFATHPPSEERIQANQETAAKYPSGGNLGIKEYQKYIARLKDAEPAYKNLDDGYEALLKNDPKKALELANEGIKLEPKEAHLYNLKGKAAFMADDEVTAQRAFDKAILINPNYFDFYLQRGLMAKKAGDRWSARDDLDKSVALFPSDEAYFALGELALESKNFKAAASHFRIAAQAPTQIGELAKRKLRQMHAYIPN